MPTRKKATRKKADSKKSHPKKPPTIKNVSCVFYNLCDSFEYHVYECVFTRECFQSTTSFYRSSCSLISATILPWPCIGMMHIKRDISVWTSPPMHMYRRLCTSNSIFPKAFFANNVNVFYLAREDLWTSDNEFITYRNVTQNCHFGMLRFKYNIIDCMLNDVYFTAMCTFNYKRWGFSTINKAHFILFKVMQSSSFRCSAWV